MKDYALFWAIKKQKKKGKKEQSHRQEYSGGSVFFNDEWESERESGGFI